MDRLLDACYQRRLQLLEQLPPDTLVVLPGAKCQIRNKDMEFNFRQSSSFYYFTGLDEADCFALLYLNKDKKISYELFVRPENKAFEQWVGPLTGVKNAVDIYRADKAHPVDNFECVLQQYLKDAHNLYFSLSETSFHQTLIKLLPQVQAQRKTKNLKSIVDLDPFIDHLRVIKSPYELECLQKAIDVTVSAHLKVMQSIRPSMMEYELEALYLYECQRAGLRFQGYNPIFAAGENACILHYTKNSAKIKDNGLFLIDAGAEYELYSADITRTFPTNGSFSSQQKELYELVLKSQMVGIDKAQIGLPFAGIQEAIVDVLAEGLHALGILKESKDTILEEKLYCQYYMHSSGHWLGLDTHDVGPYTEGYLFQENMVLTIEPGLYINASSSCDKSWHNMGIRIEDNILISTSGPIIMSGKLPKTATEIEEVMRA